MKVFKKLFLGITVIISIFVVFIAIVFVLFDGPSSVYYANNTLHLEKHTNVSFAGENTKGYIDEVSFNPPFLYRKFYEYYDYTINTVNNIESPEERPRNLSNDDIVNITIVTGNYEVIGGYVKVVDTFDAKVSGLK